MPNHDGYVNFWLELDEKQVHHAFGVSRQLQGPQKCVALCRRLDNANSQMVRRQGGTQENFQLAWLPGLFYCYPPLSRVVEEPGL